MRLIDILNKIANGELKEGTKVKILYDDTIYELYCDDLIREGDNRPIFDLYSFEVFREEVELIEPQEPTECEHEWENYTKHRIGEGIIRRYRRCAKCGLEEDIEPTDNTKIEELWGYMAFRSDYERDKVIIDKLNEVIRYINKGAEE